MLKKIMCVISLIFVLITISCGPAAGVKETKPTESSEITTDNSSEIVSVEKDNSEIPDVIIEDKIDAREMIQGYRVKVATKSTSEEADMLEKTIVDALDVPVYIEFIIDKYMVYAGDCQNKEAAEELKKKLNMMGFSQIYAVPKEVYKDIDFNKIEEVKKLNETNQTSNALSDPAAVMQIEGKQKRIGYRVQIFAGVNKDYAVKIKEKARRDLDWDKIFDKIYILLADNLYKVQIGDYKAKIEAEAIKKKIKKYYEGAFIVKTTVFEDETSSSDDDIVSGNNYNANQENSTLETGEYFIQIGAFSTPAGSEIIKARAIELGFKCEIYEDGNLFKVLVGAYPTRIEAEKSKEKLMNSGFSGAWIMEK